MLKLQISELMGGWGVGEGTRFECRIPKLCHNTSTAFALVVLQRCTANTMDDIMRYHTCAKVDSLVDWVGWD